jgi:hypothetical protein
MVGNLHNIVELICKQIVSDTKNVESEFSKGIIKRILLPAYNTYLDSEGHEESHIYDLDDKDDLVKCIKNGWLSLRDIVNKENKEFFYFKPYFFEGKMVLVEMENWSFIRNEIMVYLPQLVLNVLIYPYSGESYENLYRIYVTDKILENYENLDNIVSDIELDLE